MDDLALVAAHGFQMDLLADAARLVRKMAGKARERFLTARTVVLHIEDDAGIARLRDLVDDEIREVLQGIEGRSVLADEDAKTVPLHIVDRARRGIRAAQRHREIHRRKDIVEEPLRRIGHLLCERDELVVRALPVGALIAHIRTIPLHHTSAAARRTALPVSPARTVAACRSLAPVRIAARGRLTARCTLCRRFARRRAQIGVEPLRTDTEPIVLRAPCGCRYGRGGRRRRDDRRLCRLCDLRPLRGNDRTRRHADPCLALAPQPQKAA